MTPFLVWNPHIKHHDPSWPRRDIRKDEDAFYAAYGAPTPLAWLQTRLQSLSGSRALGTLRPGRTGAVQRARNCLSFPGGNRIEAVCRIDE